MMLSSDIRAAFIDYFKTQAHTEIPSAPLVPKGDPTLLFTNAGMVQFKTTFLGEAPRDYSRAVSSQKCMRAGGKHNDLDQVGKTARHHTFFEMLGNFSFGNYFKKEAIAFAWELLTDQFHLSKDRLWVTVYQDDDEAEQLWKRFVAPNRILRLGDADNFWQMGETGPCGPCSEILIDQGEAMHPDCPGIGVCSCDRYLEIWNLVFMQYNKTATGITSLPNPSIDTGMGLERITAICQGVNSNYQTDLFTPIFDAIAHKAYQSKTDIVSSMPARVIADHLRAMTFLMSDGVVPSNEGRGYVLRRIIRRAARFGRKLSLAPPFLHELTDSVIDPMRLVYPELAAHRKNIQKTIQMEEERFEETLNRGGAFLDEVIETIQKKGEKEIAGEAAFKLYDTYGYPVDLITEVAEEAGLTVDEHGFQTAMEAQRERARCASLGGAADRGEKINDTDHLLSIALQKTPIAKTTFTGYQHLEEDVTILSILSGGKPIDAAAAGDVVEIIFDRSPFYGESGGQVGDTGTLISQGAGVEIENTKKTNAGVHLHSGKVISGTIHIGTRYQAVVNSDARKSAARNHTATHLLHAALREIIGDHVKQAGSLVAPERLRFDFHHFAPLTQKEMDRVESCVNAQVLEAVAVETKEMAVAEALSCGATALFGEKYGDVVRVVSVSDFSHELCGGTHCRNTGEIGLFKIIREGSVASGIRRIEAVTGTVAYQVVKNQEQTVKQISELLKINSEDVFEKVMKLTKEIKEKDREIQKIKMGQIASSDDPMQAIRKIGNLSLLVRKMPNTSIKEMRVHADYLRDRLKSGIVILGGLDEAGEKATLIVMVTPEWTNPFSAAKIASEMAIFIGGSGGGNPEMAQAGGKQVDQLGAALEKSVEIVEAMGKQS
ncbi:MAG: alanine--tRNA ligase [Nitrospirota bacterium]